MRKVIMVVSILLLVLMGVGIMILNRCSEPTEMQVVLTQLRCAQSVNVEAFVQETCGQLHGTPECEFQPEDREVVQRMFLDKVNECTIKVLKDNNKCTDKYEAL